MKVAEKVLGIPHILDAEDLIGDKCDEKAVLAYLGFFKDKVQFILDLVFSIPSTMPPKK